MAGISRRDFVRASSAFALGAAGLPAWAKRAGKGRLLLAGTGTSAPSTSKGIYAYDFDPSTGELKQIGLAVEAQNPTFFAVAPHERFIYSVNEGRSATVSSFAFDKKDAKLSLINQSATKGGGPTHIAVDHTGRCVFAANYGGGSVVSFQASPEGHLSEAVSFFQYPPAGEKKRSHAHRVTPSPDNRFLLVNDLGLDVIHIYRLDPATAKLTPHDPPVWQAKPGYGPRALVFHPNGRWAYCVNELKPTVNVLEWDKTKGTLTTIQDISLVPEGYQGPSAPADIVFDRKMRFGYVPSRLDDFMATFTVSPQTGKLTFLEKTSCGGKRPRHLALDPTDRWLLVANQDTNNISVFPRDRKTGKLSNTGKDFPLDRPECLIFV
jgi:6-phosphogluconolactonase